MSFVLCENVNTEYVRVTQCSEVTGCSVTSRFILVRFVDIMFKIYIHVIAKLQNICNHRSPHVSFHSGFFVLEKCTL